MITRSIASFNPVQDAGAGALGAKSPPPFTSFSYITSANIGISPQNILPFSFNSFATLVQNFKFVSNAIPKLLNLTQDHTSKDGGFSRSNPCKIEVVITSVTEMLEFPNFGLMTTFIL